MLKKEKIEWKLKIEPFQRVWFLFLIWKLPLISCCAANKITQCHSSYACPVNCTSIFIRTDGFVAGWCIHCNVWFCMTQRSIFDVLEIIYILSVITLALSSLNTLYKMCFSIEFESCAQTYNKIHFEDVKALDTIFTLNMAIVLAQWTTFFSCTGKRALAYIPFS